MQHLLAVENELNNRPRIILNDHAPTELFAALLASNNRSCCDPPSRDRASRPQPSATHREQRRPEAAGRRASGPATSRTARGTSRAGDG
jgi:hypothetical protein